MAPIYTNNTNHTNDTDDTHHTDNPTTIGRETSPSSFFLRNKNLGQTIKTASRTRCRMVRSRLSNFSRFQFSGHRCPLHWFPALLSPNTAARCTGSPLSSLPTPLPVALVPRSPLSQHRCPLHSFPAPHSSDSKCERHAHATSFCSR